MARYAEIALEIDFSDRLVDVHGDGFDVAVRTGEATDPRLSSRRLGTFRLGLVAAPVYLERSGVPLEPADLRVHVGLLHRFPSTGEVEPWPIRGHLDGVELLAASALTASTVGPLLELAEAGAGIACLPDFITRESVAAGRLKPIMNGHLASSGSFRAVWPSKRHMPARVGAFIDHLAAELFATDGPLA